MLTGSPKCPSKETCRLKQMPIRFCFKIDMTKQIQSTDNQILRRIYGKGRGWVCTSASFQDLGSPTAVRLALMRHTRSGVIRKLSRGLYVYPRQDKQLGVLAPSVDAIAAALKIRHAIRLQPSGAYAANLLGLSDQVPMKVVFLTDGINRHVQVGKLRIIFKRTTPRNISTAGRISGLVIQALRHLGQRQVNDSVISALQCRLGSRDKKQLLADLRYAPAWIGAIMRKIGKSKSS
jgi:hypothetical protein